MAASSISHVETHYNIELREFQRSAIEAIISGKDVFVCAPTGSGKSMCYMLLSEVFDNYLKSTGDVSTVLRPIVIVLSPLVALIKDQVEKATSMGIPACCLIEDTTLSTLKDARNGQFRLVYMSPEGALGGHRDMIESELFQLNLVAVIVDEAHCITEWGEDFRPAYKTVGELRGIVPTRVRCMALTATATQTMYEVIHSTLCLSKDTSVISLPSARVNITYNVVRVKAGTSEPLRWLVEELLTMRNECPKVVVFFRNVRSLALAFKFFTKEMGADIFDGECIWQNRSVAMYHRSTHQTNKDFVLDEFKKVDSKIRVLLATVAFGMGIDIKDIRTVVHFGCPRTVEAYSQETGRAGRDGESAKAIILYHSQDLSQDHSKPRMVEFIKSKECRKQFIVNYFALKVSQSNPGCNKSASICTCCDNCREDCKCGECMVQQPWHETLSNKDLANTDEQQEEDTAEMQFLRDNLQDYIQCLNEDSSPGMFKMSLLCGLTEDVVDIIVSTFASIDGVDDLSARTGIVHDETLRTVLDIMKECTG